MFPSDGVVEETENIEELSGKLGLQEIGDGLMHSVLENDKQVIEQGKMLEQAINQGLSSFTPDLMFEQMVRNYRNAKEIFGEKIIQGLSGYDESYVERNIKIPEFRRELKSRIEEGVKGLKKAGLIDKDNIMTARGVELATLTLYMDELNTPLPTGIFGKYDHKKRSAHGEPRDVRAYRRGDHYRDIAVKKSVKTAIRRSHKHLLVQDLAVYNRQSKGLVHIIYGVDASGSMKGKKIEAAKKAGVSLAYRAIDNNDKVGLIVFKEDVEQHIRPTKDFAEILRCVTNIRASRQTNFVQMIAKSVELFPSAATTKHLIILTDALPTTGQAPQDDTLQAVANARAAGVTISVVGIQLDSDGEALAKRIVELGKGRIYVVQNVEDLKTIILEEYYTVQ